VHLSPDDLQALERVFQPGAAAGNRYPEAAMATVNR
jgi:hypothetical protein